MGHLGWFLLGKEATECRDSLVLIALTIQGMQS
jgi:hypothetical protein